MYNHLALVEHPATQIIKPLATYRASLPALHYLQKSLGKMQMWCSLYFFGQIQVFQMLSDTPYYRYYKLPGNRRSYFLLNKSSCIIYDPFTEHDEQSEQTAGNFNNMFQFCATRISCNKNLLSLQFTDHSGKVQKWLLNCKLLNDLFPADGEPTVNHYSRQYRCMVSL